MDTLVDTHCHIQSAGDPDTMDERSTLEKWTNHPELTPDTIIANALAKGVTRMVCVGCDLEDSQRAVTFVQDRPECVASIGIHPHEAKRYAMDSMESTADLEAFASLITNDKVVAVGECGLDYYYGHSTKADQEKILRFQIELALKHDKPMIFHVRGASSAEPGKDAFRDFWPIFDSYKTQSAASGVEWPIRGVLHSFTDSQSNLDKAVERGLYIGVNGISTFTKEVEQLKMYKNIPLSRILLETDAPFLTPSPYRGTICEPYHISVIAEFLGALRGESVRELSKATTNNAKNLFISI